MHFLIIIKRVLVCFHNRTIDFIFGRLNLYDLWRLLGFYFYWQKVASLCLIQRHRYSQKSKAVFSTAWRILANCFDLCNNYRVLLANLDVQTKLFLDLLDTGISRKSDPDLLWTINRDTNHRARDYINNVHEVLNPWSVTFTLETFFCMSTKYGN